MTRPRAGASMLVAGSVFMALFMHHQSAGAESATVTVTASIGSAFSMTLLTDGGVAFGERPFGAVYTADEQQRLRVISSRPWDFTDSSETQLMVGSVIVPRERVMRHAVFPAFGSNLAPGAYDITATYQLDLTTAEAFSLPTRTPIATRFNYTAVQR
ncbi:MAG: hypothetical protein ACYC6J_07495 [Coriobacteriia bacterium]